MKVIGSGLRWYCMAVILPESSGYMPTSAKVRQVKRMPSRNCKPCSCNTPNRSFLLTFFSSAVNLIIAFAQAVKHKLRHEPEYDYADLKPLINHLDTFSKRAHGGDVPATLYNDTIKNTGKGFNVKNMGEYLGLATFTSNPRKKLKQYSKAGVHHGNLPLEIMNYLSSYVGSLMKAGQMTAPVLSTQAFNSMSMMLDAFGGCERVLQTPLPVAYNIAIAQITWLYVMVSILPPSISTLSTDIYSLGSTLPIVSQTWLDYCTRYYGCRIHYLRHRCHRPRD